MRIVVVRHADAGARGSFQGPDAERPLSPLGERQAKELAEAIAAMGVGAILSSPLVRCSQTVAPLAERVGLPIGTSRLLAPDTPEEAVELLRTASGKEPLVVSTHGEVISHLLDQLVHVDMLDVGPDPAWEKGSFWEVTREGSRFTSALYSASPL